MVDEVPLLITILVIVFVITSLFTIISLNKMILSEKIKADVVDSGEQPKKGNAMVVIDIVNPAYEKEGNGDGADIK